MIVRLEKEAFKVLTQHGKEVNAKPHALQLRKSKGVALDSRQVDIHLNRVLWLEKYQCVLNLLCRMRLHHVMWSK